MQFNMEMAINNNLNLNDLILLSFLELQVNKNSDNGECAISYNEIIKSLPILFNSKAEVTNLARLRNSLNKEGFQKFITKEIIQEGRSKGAKVIFKLNKENLNKLNVKGIVKEG